MSDNTDLGNALAGFVTEYMDLLDHRTTLIVLGDGRNNFNPPLEDLFQKKCKARKNLRLVVEKNHLFRLKNSFYRV